MLKDKFFFTNFQTNLNYPIGQLSTHIIKMNKIVYNLCIPFFQGYVAREKTNSKKKDIKIKKKSRKNDPVSAEEEQKNVKLFIFFIIDS